MTSVVQPQPDAPQRQPEAIPIEPGVEAYGGEYQAQQLAKYRDREHNHWKIRIDLARRLFDEHVPAGACTTASQPMRLIDVGCSIGTFAIEFARQGCEAFGVDYDANAIEAARALAKEEGVSATFSTSDAQDVAQEHGLFDVAVCFDLFEHLFDDQMGALFASLHRALAPGGVILFHTFPTEYEYIFQENGGRLGKGLEPFAHIDDPSFARLTRAYAALHDVWRLFNFGTTHSESIQTWQHCNPTTPGRLSAILQRAGFEILEIEVADLYPFKTEARERHNGQRVAMRNLFGAARLSAG